MFFFMLMPMGMCVFMRMFISICICKVHCTVPVAQLLAKFLYQGVRICATSGMRSMPYTRTNGPLTPSRRAKV